MATPTEQQEIYVSIWSKAVETQMHFNEMCVKSRQFGLGFVSAALGLGIVLLGKGDEFSIPFQLLGIVFKLHMTVLIILSSAFALQAVKILDVNVYHKMLRGAVYFGEDFEQKYMKEIFDLEKGMTQAISHFSRHEDAKATPGNDRYTYTGTDRKDALEKIKQFYRFAIIMLCGDCGGFIHIHSSLWRSSENSYALQRATKRKDRFKCAINGYSFVISIIPYTTG